MFFKQLHIALFTLCMVQDIGGDINLPILRASMLELDVEIIEIVVGIHGSKILFTNLICRKICSLHWFGLFFKLTL